VAPANADWEASIFLVGGDTTDSYGGVEDGEEWGCERRAGDKGEVERAEAWWPWR
jgi:hypothetical protein